MLFVVQFMSPVSRFMVRASVLLTMLVTIVIPAGAQSSTDVTNIAISTTAQQTDVARLGINLDRYTQYDSGQIMRNLVYGNQGFEAQYWQTVIECIAVTATSCTERNPYTVWPADFLKGATLESIYGSSKGATGTVSSMDVASTSANTGVVVHFSGMTKAPAVGDFLIARLAISGNPTDFWNTSLGGGATLTAETSDLSPNTPGKQALRMTASGSGDYASVATYIDNCCNRSFIQLNGTYTVSFRAKGISDSTQLSLYVARLGGVPVTGANEVLLNQTVNLSGAWQEYSYTFTASEDGNYSGPVQLQFQVSGATALLDDVALEEAPASDNPTSFRNDVVTALRDLKPGTIRSMDGENLSAQVDNIIAPEFGRTRAGYYQQATAQNGIPIGLNDFLVLCKAVGADPWYTLAVATTPQEMANLIEFLAGDASTTYGAKRAALGQTDPWTKEFNKIHIELGNENWNSVMAGEYFQGGAGYAARASDLFGAAKASGSYDSSKFDLVLGAFSLSTDYTQRVMSASANYDSIDGAPYTFNSLNDVSSNEAVFGPMFAQPESIDSDANGYMKQQISTMKSINSSTNYNVYEVNLSTTTSSATQSQINSIVPSVGAGIANIDHMLLMLRDDGIKIQNMFALSEYYNYINDSKTTPLWGSTVDMGTTKRKRPQYLSLQLANSAIKSTLLTTTLTGNNPTWDQGLSQNDSIQYKGAHYLQSFAFTDGTYNSVIVLNLSRTSSLPITMSGANAPSGTVTISQLTSSNITDTNEDANTVVPTITTVNNFNPASSYSLPPFSMTVFSTGSSTDSDTSTTSTTTTLASSSTSVTSGDKVTFTASVSGKSGSPSGTVTFMDSNAAIGSASLSGGVATFSTSTLTAGTHSITASYSGDSSNSSSTSSTQIVTVAGSGATTETALATSSQTVASGASVTLTATVSPVVSTATLTAAAVSKTATVSGTVTFTDNGVVVGTATVTSTGSAAFSTSSLTTGTHVITATYSGDGTYGSSTSTTQTIVVTGAASSTTLWLSASPTTVTSGQTVYFTGTASGSQGTVTGTVTFMDNGSTIGSGTLSSGAASFNTSSLSVGTHTITASYGGDTKNQSATSTAQIITVSAQTSETTVWLSASPTTIATGQTVYFTGTVSGSHGTPTGTVTFSDNGNSMGVSTLNGSGAASFNTNSLSAGTHIITATYGGDTKNQAGTSSAQTILVSNQATSTVIWLSASPTTVNSGQTVYFTGTVSGSQGTATGTVTFLDNGSGLGSSALNGSGAASFNTSSLSVGTHTITANYGGDTKNQSSTSTVQVITITQAVSQTSTSVSISPSIAITGQAIGMSVAVSGSQGTPTGTVTFLANGIAVGSTALNGSGTASLSTSSLGAGIYAVSASYGGDTKNSGSSSTAQSLTISQPVTSSTTTLITSSTSLKAGQPVSVTAAVTGSQGTATGTIAFMDNGTSIGTQVLNSGGIASFSSSSLAAGSHALSASYTGDSKNGASTSTPIVVAVSENVTVTVTNVTVTPSLISIGQIVNIVADVTGSQGSPTGTITFLDNGAAIGSGALNGSGMAAFTTTGLTAGAHVITATYMGDSKNSASASTGAPITVNTLQGVTTTATTLSATSNSVYEGGSVSLTANVSGMQGVPSGSIVLSDNGVAVGSASLNDDASATWTLASLATGSHALKAVYQGDGKNSGSESAVQTISVGLKPDYTLAVNTNNLTVKDGTPGTTNLTVTPLNGFSGNVVLACSGLPAGATYSFSPDTVTPNGTQAGSTLTIAMTTTQARMGLPSMVGRGLAYSLLLPWQLILLLGTGAQRQKKRSGANWMRLGAVILVTGASMWATGCGYSQSAASELTSAYTITISATAQDGTVKTSNISLISVP